MCNYNILGWTNPLEVLVDGVEFTGTVFCVGDNVTFTCTVPSVAHQWSGPDDLSVLIGPLSEVPLIRGTDDRFIWTRVGNQTSGLMTSLSLIVYSGFPGATLTCSDTIQMNSETQTATATVLGEVYT